MGNSIGLINQLVIQGLLHDTLNHQSFWQFRCFDRKLGALNCGSKATLGLLLHAAPSDPQWYEQASLVLAACEESWDTCLEYRNNTWILWQYYDHKLVDDKEMLEMNLYTQLSVGSFLEKNLLLPSEKKSDIAWSNRA